MKPTTQPRIALVQSHWHDRPEPSLEAVLALVDEIADPVDLICLPEFFLGPPFYFPGRGHLEGIVDTTIPGPVTDLFSEIAVRRGCYILCGTLVEREGDRYYNTSALIDDRGEVVAKARKIHRFAAELMLVEPGDTQVLVDTPFGRVGVCVCSDFWVVEMPRMLALKGAEIIAVPGAALVGNLPITKPCIQANSSFNVCYTLFTGPVGSVTGERAGRQVSIAVGGQTTVAGPEEILGSLDGEQAVLRATLDLGYLRAMREVDLSFQRSLYWCLHGRLPELYADIATPYVGSSDLESMLTAYLS
jgi:predicted amidohydrolase